jgi:hypothetical protein
LNTITAAFAVIIGYPVYDVHGVVGAITTLDAYARYDPVDFFDLLMTIGMFGK